MPRRPIKLPISTARTSPFSNELAIWGKLLDTGILCVCNIDIAILVYGYAIRPIKLAIFRCPNLPIW